MRKDVRRVRPRRLREVRSGTWKVVGIFDAGGSAFDSEIWCDANVLSQVYKRPQNIFQSVTVRLDRRRPSRPSRTPSPATRGCRFRSTRGRLLREAVPGADGGDQGPRLSRAFVMAWARFSGAQHDVLRRRRAVEGDRHGAALGFSSASVVSPSSSSRCSSPSSRRRRVLAVLPSTT